MRKVSEDAYNAFMAKERFSKENTTVEINNGEAYMYLFGNQIAKTENGDILINHCGYKTRTTADRLNAFNVNIRMSEDKFIVNEKFIWKDGWLNINGLR